MTTRNGALASMTGFAAVSGAACGYQWEWTLRSVNGKGLDLRFRLPGGYERLETVLRGTASGKLSRGSVSANLGLKRESEQSAELVINPAALDAVKRISADIARETGAAPATVDGMLAVRGVIDLREAALDEDGQAELDAAIQAGFEKALDAMTAARLSEGAALGETLRGQLETVSVLVIEADALPARTPEAIAERLKHAVSQLIEAAPQLDAERLHQEAILAAAKADVREELDRLNAHVDAARKMLGQGGAVGRDLNFLAQEFNREANTLCSKSNDIDLTRIGLKLKGVIDQFREQVQNLE